jgi:arsenate reductase-like glutaredoxin family protein
VNARKTTLQRDDALALVKKVNEVYVAKGKRVLHFDLKKDKPSEEELTKNLLGPTGNLRAPALRKGKTLVVGFDEETYKRVFG